MGRALVGMLLLAGCRSGFESDLAELRAEIERLERDVPPDAPLWIDEGPMAFEPHVQDYTARVPDFVYNHVVRKLAQMSSGEILPQVKGALDVAAAMEDPAACRGRFWRVYGTINHLEPLRVTDRDLGVHTVYSGVLFMDGRPILFHVVDKPEVMVIGQDVVEVNGLFIKVLRYEARNGRVVDAPFVVGRRMGKFY
ncbi:MAG: hypothetical protein HYY16_00535 [Planctomycetes bacterium]|nr:hypothetical protein [Planctomycetota bacterium]